MLLRIRDHGRPLGALGMFRSNQEALFDSADCRRLESIAHFIAHAGGYRPEADSFVEGEERSLLIAATGEFAMQAQTRCRSC